MQPKNQTRSSRWAALLGFIILVIFISTELGCSKKTPNEPSKQKVSIRLKWLHQAQFAGFYYAKESGLYSKRELDVTLRPGGIDYPAIQMVASGSDQFGITGADQILLARDKEIPVVAVACIYRKSPFVLFSLKTSGISKVQDFPGKKIGVKLGGNEELTYRAMIAKANVTKESLKEIPVKFDISPLLTGAVDVWPGYSINEPITAEEKGFPVNLIWPSDYGISLYADVLFTTEEILLTNPRLVLDIVQVSLEGWRKAFDDPEHAVLYTLKYGAELKSDHERKMLDASRPLVLPDDKPLGWMDMEVWQQMHRLLRESSFLKRDVDLSKSFRVDYISSIAK